MFSGSLRVLRFASFWGLLQARLSTRPVVATSHAGDMALPISGIILEGCGGLRGSESGVYRILSLILNIVGDFTVCMPLPSQNTFFGQGT